LLLSRDWFAGRLVGVMADAALGGLMYLVLFVGIAIPADDRRLYVNEALKWVARRRRLQVAA
jgi:hypothetical protein